MQVLFQNVLDSLIEVKNQISPYISSLLLHKGRKTCSEMARELTVPVKQLYNSFNDADSKVASIRLELKSFAEKLASSNELVVFSIDGTLLAKAFAEKIEHLCVDYDGVLRRVSRGLSTMVAALIVGGNVAPLDFSFWHNKKDKIKSRRRLRKHKKSHSEKYKTKIELAVELITAWKDIIKFHYIALDGAFMSENMISFIEQNEKKYTMRAPRSRRVVIDGVDAKLCDQPKLKLFRNERCKSAKGFYKGYACTFIVNKRKKRNGKWETFYIISNMELSAKDHVIAYGRRWPIDKSFRSMKQYLGLCDCQMLDGMRQTLHIFSVFLAYSLATAQKVANKKKSVEEILKEWRISKSFQNFLGNTD